MSVAEQDQQEPVVVEQSLAARMRRAAETATRKTTDWFPVPGWDDMLEVELRAVPWETVRKISDRVAQQQRRDDAPMLEMYTYAEHLLKATEGFRELDGEPLDGETWTSLARKGSKRELPEDLTPRQAMIALVVAREADPGREIAGLWGQWQTWMNERREPEQEALRDFGPTG